MEVGRQYYFVCHAYYHYVGTVLEILGKRHCALKDCVRVHSCRRDFTSFFRHGFKEDTICTHWPDGHEIYDWISNTPFHHPVPRKSK